MALTISEAFSGSDVSRLQTTTVRDGDHWLLLALRSMFLRFAMYYHTQF